jgi:hypothetical protein
MQPVKARWPGPIRNAAISISGPHPGSQPTAIRKYNLRLRQRYRTCHRGAAWRGRGNRFVRRLSFFFNSHNNL